MRASCWTGLLHTAADGVWTELSPISPTKPAARVDHTLVLTGEVLYMFGGYRSNFYFGDLWMYNISECRATHSWHVAPGHRGTACPERAWCTRRDSLGD